MEFTDFCVAEQKGPKLPSLCDWVERQKHEWQLREVECERTITLPPSNF